MTGDWSPFDLDPEALSWARSEVERYLTTLDGFIAGHDSPSRETEQALMRQVRHALLGSVVWPVFGAFDERKPERLARLRDT